MKKVTMVAIILWITLMCLIICLFFIIGEHYNIFKDERVDNQYLYGIKSSPKIISFHNIYIDCNDSFKQCPVDTKNCYFLTSINNGVKRHFTYEEICGEMLGK